MNAGTPAEALVDFTGGVHMCVELSNPPPNLWELMYRAGQSKSLMGCGTPQGVSTKIHLRVLFAFVNCAENLWGSTPYHGQGLVCDF